MQLSSSAFRDGDEMPRRYTCDGENISPPLMWSGAPPATRSLALLCDDPDAPNGTWRHWAVYDLPTDRLELPEGAGRRGGEKEFRQAVNDFGHSAYGGPCPPRGHGAHHYRFRLLALAVDRLNVQAGASCRDVERAASKHVLAEALLVAVYRR